MEVGQLSEVVNVEGSAAPLDRTSPTIGTVIQSSQLKELPLAGRHWAGLMLLAPGAINTGDGTHLSTRFVGRARDDNNWTFDGIDATGVKDPRQDSAARLIISSESIAEFRVSSSMYSAESGMAAGGQVQLISKMGTNQFRGTAYNFIRNDAFDSRPFGTLDDLPPFSLNQFGVNLGGPIVTGKTFFFVNYEGLRQRQTQSFTRFVPSAAFRAGVTGALASVVGVVPCRHGTDERRGHRRMARHEQGDRRRECRSGPHRSAHIRQNVFLRALQLRQGRHHQPRRHRVHDEPAASQQLRLSPAAHFRARASSTS